MNDYKNTYHRKNSKFKNILIKNTSGWLIMLPTVILFAFFVWIPLIVTIVLSFGKTTGFNIDSFNGFKNYLEIFSDPKFKIAFNNTFIYLGYSLLFGFILPVIIGLLMSEVIHFKALFRIGIYLPCAIAGITASILFSYLFDPSSTGFLNNVLKAMGKETILWLDDTRLTIPLIVITMTWRGAGSTALIYLSAFQQIDKSYYEASRIDGAGPWSRIWHITLPSLIPTLSTLFVLQIISVMQVFFEPLVMVGQGGGVDSSGLSLLLLAYKYAFSDLRADKSAACTVILALIILALSSLYYLLVYFLKKKGYKI